MSELKTLLEKVSSEKKAIDESPRFLAKGDMVTIALKDFAAAKKETVEKTGKFGNYAQAQYSFPALRSGGTRNVVVVNPYVYSDIAASFEKAQAPEILYMRKA